MSVDHQFKVNALVIGAGRSGTTSLCSMLESHPEVCFSVVKEVHYFSIKELFDRGEKYYHSFFGHHKGEKIAAAADTYLLMDHTAPQRIKAYNPGMRIIVILRDPVMRAYSSYNYSVNYGHHDAYDEFIASIQKEKDIEKVESIVDRNNLGHFYGSMYAAHLEYWMEIFGRDNILILRTADLKEHPDELQRTLCRFLGIREVFMETERKNTNAVPRSKQLEKFLLKREGPLRNILRSLTPSFLKRWIMRSGMVDKLHALNRVSREAHQLDNETYKKAMEWFADDLKQLEEKYGIVLEDQ